MIKGDQHVVIANRRPICAPNRSIRFLVQPTRGTLRMRERVRSELVDGGIAQVGACAVAIEAAARPRSAAHVLAAERSAR